MYSERWQVHLTALTTSAMPPNIGAGPGLAMPCGYRNWRHVPVPASPCTRSLNPAPHLVGLGHDGTLHGMCSYCLQGLVAMRRDYCRALPSFGD